MARSAPSGHPGPLLEDEATGDWPQPSPRREPPPRPPRRHRRRSPADLVALVLALAGVALAAGALGWFLSLHRGGPPAEQAVPGVVGLREPAAVRLLTRTGFRVRAVIQPGRAPARVVFAEQPPAGVHLRRGMTVTIRVANGRKP